jgi:hypothetical protein
MWFVEQVGAHRVLFGSDGVIDGPSHYNRTALFSKIGGQSSALMIAAETIAS